jgi:pilus assembly protein CpaF
MGDGLATGVGDAVGVIERLAAELVGSQIPLDRPALEQAIGPLAADHAPLATREQLASVVDGLIGLGPLEPLLRDPTVADVLVNGPGEVWVEREGKLERTAVAFPDSAAICAAVERAVSPLGLRFDRAAPIVDARLADGSRLHAVMPPASVDHPVLAIRRFTRTVRTLDGLVGAGSATPRQADRLREIIAGRRNIVVSGGTSSGKTTLLNVLSGEIPPGDRVVVVEDAAELALEGHIVRLEARPPNVEGAGEITLSRLLRSALRLRPDRIVLGEVRGPEALDLLTALNTGHDGSMSTIHANGPDEALWRLQTLALSGARRIDPEAVRRQLDAAVHVVIQLERVAGRRRIAAIVDRHP